MIGKNATLEVEIPGHGLYACTIKGMDWALAQFVATGLLDVKRRVLELWHEDGIIDDLDQPGILNSLTECLIVLAYLHGYHE